jgi:hypothetical protein
MAELEEQLRKALRAREPLMLDADEILAGVDRRFKRRCAQRRALGAAAIVAVTTVGLSVGAGLLRGSDQGPEPAPVAVAPPDTTVTAPSLPFTVDQLRQGATPTSWTIDAVGSAQAQYRLPETDKIVRVSLTRTDPESQQSDAAVRTQVNGHPAALRWFGSSGTVQVSWELVPGRWASVVIDSSEDAPQQVVALASSVRFEPSAVSSSLRSFRPPAGLEVASWSRYDGLETVSLCSSKFEQRLPQTPYGQCVTMNVHVGGFTSGGVDIALKRLDRSIVVDGVTLLTTDDGQAVKRQFAADRWLLVETGPAGTAMLPALAASAVVN